MSKNENITRRSNEVKLGANPSNLNKNTITKSTIRSRGCFYNTLPSEITKMSDHKKFRKVIKPYMLHPMKKKLKDDTKMFRK